jgi:predicted RNA-binding Zn-ribbon protein involved in translation (DUF1610 family)
MSIWILLLVLFAVIGIALAVRTPGGEVRTTEMPACHSCGQRVGTDSYKCPHCGIANPRLGGRTIAARTGPATPSGPLATRAAVNCPKCGSDQLTGGKAGFGLGKAAAGGVLLGPVGLLGGMVGSGKVQVGCMNCGHRWKPRR